MDNIFHFYIYDRTQRKSYVEIRRESDQWFCTVDFDEFTTKATTTDPVEAVLAALLEYSKLRAEGAFDLPE